MSANVIQLRPRRRAAYQAGPNWPLLVVLAISIGIWATAGAIVWWLI